MTATIKTSKKEPKPEQRYTFVDANGKDVSEEVYAEAARIQEKKHKKALKKLGRGLSDQDQYIFHLEIGEWFCEFLSDEQIGELYLAYRKRRDAYTEANGKAGKPGDAVDIAEGEFEAAARPMLTLAYEAAS